MLRIGRIAAVLILALAGATIARAAPVAGRLAPALRATELDGRAFDLADQRGKVVIVNFWASWCAPCRAEMPALDAFNRAFRGRGLVTIGISVDRWSDRAKVKALAASLGYPAAMLSEVSANGFGVPKAIPVTYVIDRDGVLRAILRPDRVVVTARTLARIVLPLLREQPAPAMPGEATQTALEGPGSANLALAGVRSKEQ